MSCRQPPRRATPAVRKIKASHGLQNLVHEGLIIGHLADILRVQILQKPRSLYKVELWIARLEAEEKTVTRSMLLKALHIKQRVIRLRELVEREHPEYREQ